MGSESSRERRHGDVSSAGSNLEHQLETAALQRRLNELKPLSQPRGNNNTQPNPDPPKVVPNYNRQPNPEPPKVVPNYNRQPNPEPPKVVPNYNRQPNPEPPKVVPNYTRQPNPEPPRVAPNYNRQPNPEPSRVAPNYNRQPNPEPPREAPNYNRQPNPEPLRGAPNYNRQPNTEPLRGAPTFYGQPNSESPREAPNYNRQPNTEPPRGAPNYNRQPYPEPSRVAPNYNRQPNTEPHRGAPTFYGQPNSEPPRGAPNYNRQPNTEPPRGAPNYNRHTYTGPANMAHMRQDHLDSIPRPPSLSESRFQYPRINGNAEMIGITANNYPRHHGGPGDGFGSRAGSSKEPDQDPSRQTKNINEKKGRTRNKKDSTHSNKKMHPIHQSKENLAQAEPRHFSENNGRGKHDQGAKTRMNRGGIHQGNGKSERGIGRGQSQAVRGGPNRRGRGAHENGRGGFNRSTQDLREEQCHNQGHSNKWNGVIKMPGYLRLEEWSQKDPTDIINTISNTHNGFILLLNSELRPDFIFLVIKLLAKACQADFDVNKAAVLSSIFSTSFIKRLTVYMASMHSETQAKTISNMQDFFKDLLLFCETVMNLLPSSACEHLVTVITFINVAMLQVTCYKTITFDESSYTQLENLQTQIKIMLDERTKKVIKETSRDEVLKYQPPPDNFRDIDIFPNSDDILSTLPVFIRPNISKGAYIDVDHYLDVQFRLLREDFVGPLREGINEFMGQDRKKKVNNIRVLRKVKFQGVQIVKDHLGLVVQFEPPPRVNWEHSKRLMYGSLLCFTKDKFKTVHFATVLDRDVKLLQKGQLTVELSQDEDLSQDMNIEYLMVESEVYFAPYQHVLKALQRMNQRDFPMMNYIVNVEPLSTPPQYVLDQNDQNFQYCIDGFRIFLLQDASWPTPLQLNLDESQFLAFKMALTKEFVVIQGPPGTGKTYLGLKIAKTLLENATRYSNYQGRNGNNNVRRDARLRGLDYFDSDESDDLDDEELDTDYNSKTPMLVVCFTNHALDQFLEGLLEKTQNIIRVGGQSKSEKLKEFNLNERRRNNPINRKGEQFRYSRDLRNQMSACLSRTKGVQADIEQLKSPSGIISINCIIEAFNHTNIKSAFMADNGTPSNENFLEWLETGRDLYVPEEFRENAGNVGVPTNNNDTPQEAEIEENKYEEVNKDEEAWQRVEEIGYDLEHDTPVQIKVSFAFTLNEITERSKELNDQLDEYHIEDAPWLLKHELLMLSIQSKYFTHWLLKRPSPDPDVINMINNKGNLWELTSPQRWSAYFYWISLMIGAIQVELHTIQQEYRDLAKRFEEIRDMENLEIMRTADVVGMTTTMAAKSQPLLQALKSKIVIVEEAAEVMESHIIVSLTKHCQHLILIGDHQQLRPTTAVYKLAKQYKFDISLFERMLNNGLHCERLKVQHRMRPEIAHLIVPSIYESLVNHESVLDFEKIKGVTKSVFFLTHQNKEQEITETSSKQNSMEGDMILAFCRHLLLQGYPPEHITILTTYSGQMFYLRSESKKYPLLKGVLITIVDNYQGEENQIILLSLVRNNSDNNVGFLKIPNRVCVALSRAKQGLFIMGNMNNLLNTNVSHDDPKVWPKIKEALDEQGAVGEYLTLKCEIHEDQLTEVKEAKDFHKVPEGGCQLPCSTELACGHICKSMCHARDREHREYRCKEKCTRTPPKCDLDHICPKLCFDDCGDCHSEVQRLLPCGHAKMMKCYENPLTYECKVKVSMTSADCGHTFDRPCHKEPNTVNCPEPCRNRLDCGHSCKQLCHVNDDPDHISYKCMEQCAKKNAGCTGNHNCTRKCHEECGNCLFEVEKRPLNCDHIFKVACSKDPAEMVCKKPCKRTMDCGHKCQLECHMACGNCKEKVEKIVDDCGHKVTVNCSEKPERKHCRGACPRLMDCGHVCIRTCKDVCSTRNQCDERVNSLVLPVCKHRILVPCHVQNKGLLPDSEELLAYCEVKCFALLKCGHTCAGSCGTCLQGRIHMGCREKCNRTLICGHACKEPCAAECPPCKEKCRMECCHSRCNRKCGEPCAPCKMKCERRCEHRRCSKRCDDFCNCEPCNEPCQEITLPCKHPCIGFCGEPCPPLCRICDEEEVTTIFFGNEDDPDARFVYLADCKHTIESEALETWLKTGENPKDEIRVSQCPRCKTDIMTTLRYMNQIKQVNQDVMGIKKKLFGDKKLIERNRSAMIAKLVNIDSYVLEALSADATKFVANLLTELKPVKNKRRNPLSQMDVETLSNQLDILMEIYSSFNKVRQDVNGSSLDTLLIKTEVLLSELSKRKSLSTQEVEDFNLELCRYRRLAQFCQLDSKLRTIFVSSSDGERCRQLGRRFLLSVERYSNETDEILEKEFKRVNTLKLAEMEIREVVRAVGLAQGHWFKCPNGHYYAIGECGGAMEESKCIECGAGIGGSSHRLLATNQVATEIDGAAMGAYDRAALLARPFL